MATEQQHPCCSITSFYRPHFHLTIFSSTGSKICWEYGSWLLIQSDWQPGSPFCLRWCFHYGFNEFSHIRCWQMLPQEKWKAICLSSQKHHRHTFVGWWGVSPYDTLHHRFKLVLRVQFKQTCTFTSIGRDEMCAVYLKRDNFRMETRQMSHSTQELINKLWAFGPSCYRQVGQTSGARWRLSARYCAHLYCFICVYWLHTRGTEGSAWSSEQFREEMW